MANDQDVRGWPNELINASQGATLGDDAGQPHLLQLLAGRQRPPVHVALAGRFAPSSPSAPAAARHRTLLLPAPVLGVQGPAGPAGLPPRHVACAGGEGQCFLCVVVVVRGVEGVGG